MCWSLSFHSVSHLNLKRCSHCQQNWKLSRTRFSSTATQTSSSMELHKLKSCWRPSSSMIFQKKCLNHLPPWKYPPTLSARCSNPSSSHICWTLSKKRQKKLSTRSDRWGLSHETMEWRRLVRSELVNVFLVDALSNYFICSLLLSLRLLNHCERFQGSIKAADRKLINDAFFVTPFFKDGEDIQLELKAETFMTTRKPITPFSVDTSSGAEVPDIFPLKFTVSIPEVQEYKEQIAYRKIVSKKGKMSDSYNFNFFFIHSHKINKQFR